MPYEFQIRHLDLDVMTNIMVEIADHLKSLPQGEDMREVIWLFWCLPQPRYRMRGDEDAQPAIFMGGVDVLRQEVQNLVTAISVGLCNATPEPRWPDPKAATAWLGGDEEQYVLHFTSGTGTEIEAKVVADSYEEFGGEVRCRCASRTLTERVLRKAAESKLRNPAHWRHLGTGKEGAGSRGDALKAWEEFQAKRWEGGE